MRRRTGAKTRLCLFGLLLSVLFLASCGSPYSTKRITIVDLFKTRGLNALNSDQASQETRQYLRLAFLEEPYKEDPIAVIEQMVEKQWDNPDPDTIQAIAELTLLEGRAMSHKDPELAMELYLTSAHAAYAFLLRPREKGSFNALKPSYRFIADIYNAAVSDLLDLQLQKPAEERRKTKTIETPHAVYEFSIEPASFNTFDPSIFDRIVPAYLLQAKGLTNEYYSRGLGAPLIGLVENPYDNPKWGSFYPKDRAAYSMTAILQFLESVQGTDKRIVPCMLGVYNPMAKDSLVLFEKEIPIEADFSTPLVYQLEHVKPFQVGISGLLPSDKLINQAGLFMLEPYQPEKIPVVMVHGLASSPITWVPVFNDLRGDPWIRKHYQFWFFHYPTGLPIIYSGSLLRQDLNEIRNALDPEHTNLNLDNIVLIGHSMGGLLSRLMMQNSEQTYWDSIFAQPPDEMPIDKPTKELLRQSFFFEVQPYITRVVFVATPHRGSPMADTWYAKFGAGFINLPGNITNLAGTVLGNEEIKVRDAALRKTKRIKTSIELLSPESIFMRTQLTIPLLEDIPYHSIIGTEKEVKEGPGSSDGVVPYWSSHIDFAQSEVLVPANHGDSKHHPLAIQEMKRILRLHLKETPTERN